MKRILIFGIILVVFLISFAYAETSVKAEVDRLKLATDETLTYKITIVSDQKNLPAPKPAEFKGFRVLSSGQSSAVSMSGGEVKTIVSYSFILSPVESGKLKIAPVGIEIAGEKFESDEFEIEVTEAMPSSDEPWFTI